MFEDHVSLARELRPVFVEIGQRMLMIRNNTKKFRLYEYDDLADMHGEIEDWKCEGRVRRMMYGSEGRRWLLYEFKLWWKSDDAEHSGLLFTADPRTGIEWERNRRADRTHRDGLMLREFSDYATKVNPMFRDHYLSIGREADRLILTGERLKELGDADRLRLIGVTNGDSP